MVYSFNDCSRMISPDGEADMIVKEGKRERRWPMLMLAFVIALLVHLLLFSTAPMVTLIMGEMELSHADFGFIFSAAMVSLIIFRIPWGLIGDRLGYLNALKMALPVCTVAAVLRAFSDSYWTLLVSQFFIGLGLAAVLPCLPLLVREWSPRATGFATGVYVSGLAAGNAAALGLTPALLEIMSWRDVLLVYSGVAAVICVLWWTLARSAVKSTSGFRFINVARFLKDRYIWVLLFFMMASMGCYDTLATWIPKVLEMKELSKTLASLLPLGFFLAGPVFGVALDRFQNRKILVTLLGVVAAISITGINYAPLPLMLLCIFLSGFTIIGVLTLSLAMPARHERLSPYAGSVVGFISSFGNVGPLVVPVVFGYLIDVTGTFQVSVIVVALLAGFTFILGSRVSE